MTNAKYFWAVSALTQPQPDLLRNVLNQCISLGAEKSVLKDALLLAEDYRRIRQKNIMISKHNIIPYSSAATAIIKSV